MAILILSEFWSFIESVYKIGFNETKKTNLFKSLNNIIKRLSTKPCAIPYWSLFDNVDYVDLINNDFVKFNPVYDVKLESFVFSNIFDMYYGVYEILKMIREHYPNDYNVEEKYNMIKYAMKLIENYNDMCDLSEYFSNKFTLHE
jgi:hypothetical protein